MNIEANTEANTDATIEWLEQLAEDNYNQCTGWVNSEFKVTANPQRASFCCLGVAREVLRQFDDQDVIPDTADDDSNLWDGASALEMLTYDETNVLGIKDPEEFSRMNDSRKMSFPEIAKEAISEPHYYFTEETAEAIEEHFYG